ncbi:hypothetical protein N7493_005705 [Penicillium malachiteum]|uniref:Atos-like conserved domain-containing protein n=1 Tax=Penicillium malachiteum TaxID=1324776 RepID=A0AAD6HN57_9EURO|nr:hypothetical protein N7493_005705 [Penicillium malachiteum]
MPLFQDPDRRWHPGQSGDQCQYNQPAPGSPPRILGKENLRKQDAGFFNMEDSQPSSLEASPSRLWSSEERQQLIQRIKESSPWRLQYKDTNNETICMPHEHLESQGENRVEEDVTESQPQPYTQPTLSTEGLGSPADIQRPRSALHSGDFREGTGNALPQSPRPLFQEPSPTSTFPHFGTSPTTPWFGGSAFQAPSGQLNPFFNQQQPDLSIKTRSRAPSLGSFSSSYVLKVPTSPLVYQANNTDLDFSPIDPRDATGLMDKANRRRTLPPESFRHLQTSPSMRTAKLQHPSSPGAEDVFFQPPHFPRRSLTSAYSLQLASTSNAAAYHRQRRSSFVSDASPKPHAPLVGSYEESILRGRMSMNPSKPLDFTAQIGVLGKGKCKGHLKCPPHITIPFPAVFYSYPTSGNGRSISDDRPSPYVGQIDLENSLSKDDPSIARRRRRHFSPAIAPEDGPVDESRTSRLTDIEARRRREKRSRRTGSPKCPPGGCYRIPQQGQLQIIIKNPHKTAVKLFLVPYDLSDMEPGTKTFIRQRSYSAGPIIDMPLSSRKNYGTDRPEASLNATEDPQDKPTLRYLIHLNICCPSRGRFYIHSSIRVVFANRVPDGKEKLRNEIQLPEPRYSPYKPTREPSLTTSANARLAVEGSPRRRSQGNGPLEWSATDLMDFQDSSDISQQTETALYKKLNRGDSGYGGQLVHSQGVSDTGESLLAKRLRGLDVQRQGSFDRNWS